ncbi:16S rRNA (cytidine(1402)-2'-O)-methyltransferase [Roseibaca sp. V10]|uniref:Ribosomal RNA small subunit methyltransferase I n=1 Tax=Roseinatronobacter domitianus TaxID=2940293 RepID=A0ABT0M0F7_9RHOB|nr:16S rRNA (cytidine(1402)-2'-O)-methyltransferase [Roseibaca domitiana]MCL1628349.1 16S rRNA (cytidine(1402)-2'-O)-methyltransferase [Roseibaca domitiana]
MPSIDPGLHLIATPIGAARDITLRALDLLEGCDLLVAEDTRSLRRLMELHGVSLNGRRVLPYHDHNGAQMRPKLLTALQDGKSVLYASEAGTPLVSDPGFGLARAAIDAGLPVLSAPGASAVMAALCVAGLPSDRFCFMGFPPAQAGARKQMLQEAAIIPATLLFYESPKRIHRLLGELCDTLGADRQAALCRELTKRHEEVLRMPLGEMTLSIQDRTLKGEIVLVVDRAPPRVADAATLDAALDTALRKMSVKEAAAHVARDLGLPRRDVYQAALQKGKDE